MRIAQIAPLFESVPPKRYGGTERVVHHLTRGLLEQGVDVTVFCSGDSQPGCPVDHVCPEALRLARREIHDPVAFQMLMLGAVLRRAQEFDLIHNHYDYPLLPLARMSPVPFVSTQHGRMDYPSEIKEAYVHFGDIPIVSISDAQRRPMPNLNWIATIHHGIPVEELPLHPEPGKYLAFLGRFSPEKCAHWAIEIAVRSGIPLKLAAKIDDTNLGYYESAVKPRIDGRFIQYVGEISDAEKAEFLGNALALVFPIDWPEPFGLVMLEAMACGTPVLARPMGSVPEVLVDGVTGFARADIRELARLAEDVPRLDRAAIRRHVERNFSIQRMTWEYLNVYRELVGAPQRQDTDPRSSHDRRMAHGRRNLLYSIDGAAERDSKGIA